MRNHHSGLVLERFCCDRFNVALGRGHPNFRDDLRPPLTADPLSLTSCSASTLRALLGPARRCRGRARASGSHALISAGDAELTWRSGCLTLAPPGGRRPALSLRVCDVRALWAGYPLEEPLRGQVALRGSRGMLRVDATWRSAERARPSRPRLLGAQPATT